MKFRHARHTNNLEKIKFFYINILGFELLGGFQNHNGYDGIFIGKSKQDWHLEFTTSDEIVNFNFGEEDYLVFYPDNRAEYDQLKHQLIENSIIFIPSKNPFWNENGMIVKDPDGCSIVISNYNI